MLKKSLFFLYLLIVIFSNSCRNQQEVDYPEVELLPDQSVNDVLIAYRLHDTNPLIDKFRSTSADLLPEHGNGRVSEDILQDFGIDWQHILRIENDSMDVEVYSVQVNDETRPFDVLNLVYFYREEQLVNTFLMEFTADSVLVSRLLSGEVGSWVDYVEIFTGRLSFYDVESGEQLVSWDLSEDAVSSGRCPCSGGLYDPRCCQGRRKTRRTRVYSDSGGSGGISGYSGGYGGFSAGVALSTSMSFVGIPSYGGGYAFSGGGGGVSGVVGAVNYPVAVPQITSEELLRSVEIFNFLERIELDESFEDNPCIMAVYNDLEDGLLFDVLAGFVNNPSVNLIWVVADVITPNDEFGLGYTAYDDVSNSATITIDKDVLGSSDHLAIAAIIIHEAIHAEMLRAIANHSNTVPVLGTSIVDLLKDLATYENVPHAVMVLRYREVIKQGLYEYLEISEGDNDYYDYVVEALSWGGLLPTVKALDLVGDDPDDLLDFQQWFDYMFSLYGDDSNRNDALIQKNNPCQE